MNRPETVLAALLLSVVIVAPAAAQQAPLAPQPTVSQFCSGCFAYLEFPPLPEDGAPSSPASAQQGRCRPPPPGRRARSGRRSRAWLPPPGSDTASTPTHNKDWHHDHARSPAVGRGRATRDPGKRHAAHNDTAE